MVLDPAPQRLYQAVATLEHRSLQDWRARYYPSLTLEGALTQRINVVEVHVTRRAGGNVSVTVSVVAKKAFECNVDYFSLQRRDNHWYEKVGGPSTAESGEVVTKEQ